MSRRRTISKWLERLKGAGFSDPDEETVDTFVFYTAQNGDQYRNLVSQPYEFDSAEKSNQRTIGLR